jgi:cysteinyl-tRNA synthetase
MLRNTYQVFLKDILGLKEDYPINYKPLIGLLLEQYQFAKQQKDYAQVDKIRNALREQHIVVQDGRHGVSWSYQTVS